MLSITPWSIGWLSEVAFAGKKDILFHNHQHNLYLCSSWIKSWQITWCELKLFSHLVLALRFSCLFSWRPFAAKTGPEIGVPCVHFCANNKYTACFFWLHDKSMLSIWCTLSALLYILYSRFSMSYSFANDDNVLDPSFIFSLSSILWWN